MLSNRQSLLLGVSLVFETLTLSTSAVAEAQIWRIAEPSPGMPRCEEFFDQWEAPGVPPAMLAIAGIGRELMAAADCVQKNDIARACQHLERLLPVMERLGPPISDDRAKVEKQLQDYQCDRAGTGGGEAEPGAEGSAPPPSPEGESGGVSTQFE
ncbi:MAG TPA: hypothetical protein VNJ31_01530 [Methyloceanibacter sp.]|nr:hypothetical protein [Methyloceanibacter sp.]